MSRRDVEEYLAGECGFTKTSCATTRSSARQQLTALTIGKRRLVEVNHCRVDEVHAARCAEDADQLFDSIFRQVCVRSLASITTRQASARICDRDRSACKHLQNGRNLPATDQTIPTTNITEPAFSSTERKFVDGVEIEYVRRVVIGSRVFDLWEEVREIRFEVGLADAGRVGQRLLEGVVGLQVEAV